MSEDVPANGDETNGELVDDDIEIQDATIDGTSDDAGGEVDEMTKLRAERDEYLDHVRRVQADFENYRKRVVREQTSLLEHATRGLIERLLPVLDAFELALFNAETIDIDRLRKGVELAYAELLGTLEQAGLQRIEATGQPFDPAVHEAVVQVEADGVERDQPIVVDVMRTGYRLSGTVIRPAMVKVAR